MKIIIVTQCFYPDNYHINHIVQDMTQRGHQVTVVTGLPDYTTSKVPKEYKHFRHHHDYLGDVEVWRVPIIARRHGALMRFINYLSFIVSGSVFCALKKFQLFDLIYVWGATPVTMAIPAIVLKKRAHKPLFFYCLDLWPESLKAFHLTEANPVYKMVDRLCRWIYKNCDRVAVSSTPFFDYIEQVNRYPREKMFYLPQYGADEYLEKDLTAQDNGVVDFLYAGNIGTFQKLDCIIEAVEKIRDVPGYHVHFVGDGSTREQLEQMTREKYLEDKITFHGRVPFEKMEEYYCLADACLLTLDGSNKIGDTLPVKMQGYMAAGKPVIAAINGAGRQVIEQSGCGLCVAAGDAEGLARAMRQFAENPAQYAACGENGRSYFRTHFTKEQHFETLEAQLNALTGTTRFTERELV